MPNHPSLDVFGLNVAPTAAIDGIAALDQDLPSELGRSVIVPVGDDFDDVAKSVVGPWVGGIDLVRLALAVVGQHHVDLVGLRIGLNVLGPVHLRGAEQVGSRARLDDNVGLALEAIGVGQRSLAMDQRPASRRSHRR